MILRARNVPPRGPAAPAAIRRATETPRNRARSRALDRLHRPADLVRAGHEHEQVAGVSPATRSHSPRRDLPHRLVLEINASSQVLDSHGKAAALRHQHIARREIILQRAGIERRRHHDDFQVGPVRLLNLQRTRERDVAVEMALVKLVEHDRRDAAQRRIERHLPQQDPLRYEPNPRALADRATRGGSDSRRPRPIVSPPPRPPVLRACGPPVSVVAIRPLRRVPPAAHAATTSAESASTCPSQWVPERSTDLARAATPRRRTRVHRWAVRAEKAWAGKESRSRGSRSRVAKVRIHRTAASGFAPCRTECKPLNAWSKFLGSQIFTFAAAGQLLRPRRGVSPAGSAPLAPRRLVFSTPRFWRAVNNR